MSDIGSVKYGLSFFDDDRGLTMVQDLQEVLRMREGRKARPTTAIMDSRTLQSTPESGGRGGYDGGKRRRGSEVHIAVDTLGHLLALHLTPAEEQDRAQVGVLAEQIQQRQYRTGLGGPGMYRFGGGRIGQSARPSQRFVLLPRRWVVERTFGWAARFRRLVRDFERLPETVAGMHFIAFACLFLKRAYLATTQS